MEMYQQESAYDAEMFLDKDISMFQKVLGADAAMFTIIRWCLLVLCALIDEGVIDIEARVRNLDRGYYQGLAWCCKAILKCCLIRTDKCIMLQILLKTAITHFFFRIKMNELQE